MNGKSNKTVLLVKALFYAIIVVFSGIFLYQFSGKPLPENFFGVPNYEVWITAPQTGDPSLGLMVGYVLLAMALVLIAFFSIKQIASNPKKSLISLLGVAAIVVLFFICYSASSGEMTLNGKITESYSKLVGGSLLTVYVMFGVTILALILGEIWSSVK